MRRSELMEPRTLQYMALAASSGQLTGPRDALVQRVCTDSRHARAGDLFVALRGDRFDGHDFLQEVIQHGVTGVVIERGAPCGAVQCGVVVVDDTRMALGRMAARYRQDFQLPLVAVGGSNGKTTTKEIVAAVLRQKFTTLSSAASFNNDIGVPTTLFELNAEHQAAVLEFGTNHPGELAPLLRIAQPLIGIITSIGREHLEFFGDLDGVIQEEGALAEMLPPHGKLFINGDTPGAERIALRCHAPVARVGLSEGLDWRATILRADQTGVHFGVRSPLASFDCDFHIPLLGRHQAINALLAIAVAAELGLNPDDVQRGLSTCAPAKMRLQLGEWNGVQFLDDCYNANADSVRAALETLAELPCSGRRVAVLGDMAELGLHAEAAHEEIGRHAAASHIDHLVTVGKLAALTARSAREAGLRSVQEFADVEQAADALSRFLRAHDLVLLKASRATALERVRQLLRNTLETDNKNEAGQRPNQLGNG